MTVQLNQQEQQLFDDCVKYNSLSSQMRQYNEEMAEGLLALAKYQRAVEWGTPEEQVQALNEWKSEMADCIIMNLQMAHIFGLEDVVNLIDYKLGRQQIRINKKKEQYATKG